LQDLLEEQELTEKKIADIDSGNRVKPRLISILKKNQLKNVLIDYDQYGALEYLEAVSSNFKF
jgi:hypothetical protein